MEIVGVNPNPFPKEFGLSVRALFGFPDDAILGCTDDDYVEYNPQANYDDGSCEVIAIDGCTNPDYLNYNEVATLMMVLVLIKLKDVQMKHSLNMMHQQMLMMVLV